MSKQRVIIEAVRSETMRGRYHYRALNTPDFFNLGPNHARSLRTWASKRSAIAAGLREWPSAAKQAA
jgi:hypothetical protein